MKIEQYYPKAIDKNIPGHYYSRPQGNTPCDYAQVVKLVDDVQNARVSREAGADSDHANWLQASRLEPIWA